MNIQKKILLGSEDIITRDNEDEFITLELIRTVAELRPDVINNDFNLSQQFDKERDESLTFSIFGVIDSKKGDSDGVDIKIESNDGTVLYNPNIEIAVNTSNASAVHNIKSIPLSKDNKLSKNIYGNNKSTYIFTFELSAQTLQNEIDSIIASGGTPQTKSVILSVNDKKSGVIGALVVPYLFFDEDGERINFGTETSELTPNGDTVDINNNFPFLYDRHWIRSDFIPSGLLKASFGSLDVQGNPKKIVTENAGIININVNLDFPSVLGNEELTVILVSDVPDKNSDFNFTSEVLKWKAGEQTKSFEVEVLDDLITEDEELFIFGLRNPKNIEIEGSKEYALVIQDDDVPSIANFEIDTITTLEGEKEITIKVLLDRPVEAIGQSVKVFLSETLGGATSPDDFELKDPLFVEDGSGVVLTSQEALDSVTMLARFEIGETSSSVFVIVHDRPDEINVIDKELVFVLSSQTSNIEIGNTTPKFTLKIQDNFISKSAKCVIPGNSEKGYGVFRQKSSGDAKNLQWIHGNIDNENIFRTGFTYTLNVTNAGERVRFNGAIIENGQAIFASSFTNSFQGLEIDLPSNFNLNEQTRSYEEVKYKFAFWNIEELPLPDNIGKIGGPPINDFLFNSVVIETGPVVNGKISKTKGLEATEDGNKTYNLISVISEINSKLTPDLSSFLGDIPAECELEGISNRPGTIRINGIVFLSNKYQGLVDSLTEHLTRLEISNFEEGILEDKCEQGIEIQEVEDEDDLVTIKLPVGGDIV